MVCSRFGNYCLAVIYMQRTTDAMEVAEAFHLVLLIDDICRTSLFSPCGFASVAIMGRTSIVFRSAAAHKRRDLMKEQHCVGK